MGLVLVFVMGALAGGRLATASPWQDAPAIHLKARTIVPSVQPEDRLLLEVALRTTATAAAHALVQLEAAPDPVLRTQLAARGIELQGYTGSGAYLARVRQGALGDLSDLPVGYIGLLRATDKLEPRLAAGVLPEHARLADGQAACYVEFHADVDLDDGIALVLRLTAGRVIGRLRSLNGALIAVGVGDWAHLAQLEAVKWVEAASPRLDTRNDGIRASVGADQLHGPPLGLDGSGVNVIVYDAGSVCEFHPDLVGRVIRAEPTQPSAHHAMHVAGTLAGSGQASGGLRRGLAPAAQVISYVYESCDPLCLYNNPQDLEDNYLEGILSHKADFANNSLGSNISANNYDCALEGDYENTARLVDAIARGSLGRPFASFWAAGNERGAPARCGSDYYTTGVPATSKNAIVVGATYSDTNDIADFSSFGPVDDGRLRPDVVAPGCQQSDDFGITSLKNCFGYAEMCGTSMSTPAVAGGAALVLQHWRNQGHTTDPLPSTYKALLAATATDLGTPGPDYQSGYGHINLPAAVGVVDSGTVVEASVTDGEVITYAMAIDSTVKPLRVVLAWDDVPGEPLSAINLVNDLDLAVVSPSGEEILPFVLDPNAPADAAIRGRNSRDNAELVEVANPTPGVWQVVVRGYQVPEGPQTFSVVATAPPPSQSSGIAAPFAPASGSRLALRPATPNPFNPRTHLTLDTAGGATPLSLRILAANGRLVRVLVDEERLPAGVHRFEWDGRDGRGQAAASGAYFAEVIQGNLRRVQRLTLLR